MSYIMIVFSHIVIIVFFLSIEFYKIEIICTAKLVSVIESTTYLQCINTVREEEYMKTLTHAYSIYQILINGTFCYICLHTLINY